MGLALKPEPLFLGLLAVTLLAGALYSLPPVRFKTRGWWGVMVGGAAQRTLPLLVLAALYGLDGPTHAALVALLAIDSLALGARFMLIHQQQDAEADRATGIVTIGTHSTAGTMRRYVQAAFAIEILSLAGAVVLISRLAPASLIGWLLYGAIFIAMLPHWLLQPEHDRWFNYILTPLWDFYSVCWPIVLAAALAWQAPAFLPLLLLEFIWKSDLIRVWSYRVPRRYMLQHLLAR